MPAAKVRAMARDPRGDIDVAADTDSPSATLLAIRNAIKLGASLVFTWGIALAIRLLLPRYLGPIRFGTLSFADGFTSASFIVLGLGAEAYIRKEVAVRPSHASDFFAGTFVLRVALTGAILAAMYAVLRATGRPGDVCEVVMLYGVAQFFVNANATFSAMLHAKGRVGAMSVLAVATKIVWAVGILIAMVRGAGLWAYAASYLASESVETVVLWALARRHLGLKFRVEIAATRAMLLASLPYYLTLFATTAYGKLDVSLLEFMGSTEEVGWYGAANAVAGLTLLATPLIGWVLMPMFARAAARSQEEFYEQIRRSMELVLTVAIPAGLVLYLGADVWVRFLFGAAFAPAAMALRVLAPMFVLMYVSIIYSIALVMLERAWTQTLIAVVGLVVNVILNLVLIRFSMRAFGPGGGGKGCSLAMLGTEIVVSGCMIAVVGRGGFDRRGVATVLKSLLACAVAVAAHGALARIGPLRLLVDAIVYTSLVLATGALRLREMVAIAREAIRRRE
jgi:O-antigen/teichoic acid export membrane protein